MDTYGYLAPNTILDTVAEDAGYLVPDMGTTEGTKTFENMDCDSSEAIASLYKGIKDEEGKSKVENISGNHFNVSWIP